MLAVFGPETAHPPPGITSPKAGKQHHTETEDDEACGKILAEAGFKAEEIKKTGKGTGFGFSSGPYVSYACKEGVHVVFSGEISEWPGIDAVSSAHNAFLSNIKPPEADDAHWLLDFYSTFNNTESGNDDEGMLQDALECLSMIKGSFGFIIYDSLSHRLLAARDVEGVQPLYWGSTPEGRLLFGSNVADLKDCDPTSVAFPAGSLFLSARHTIACQPGPEGWVITGEDYPGELLSFVKADLEHWKSVRAIPRITSQGVIDGTVYKVSSQPDLQHPAR